MTTQYSWRRSNSNWKMLRGFYPFLDTLSRYNGSSVVIILTSKEKFICFVDEIRKICEKSSEMSRRLNVAECNSNVIYQSHDYILGEAIYLPIFEHLLLMSFLIHSMDIIMRCRPRKKQLLTLMILHHPTFPHYYICGSRTYSSSVENTNRQLFHQFKIYNLKVFCAYSHLEFFLREI